jgi:hypothetical protein
MKTVSVFVYSYKEKNLYEIIKKNTESFSNDYNFIFYVYDQNNINRSKYFKDLKSVNYSHVFWDCYFPISKYREEVLSKESDFFLEISDRVVLNNNFDKDLFSFLEKNENCIVSGNTSSKLLIDKFYVKNISNNYSNEMLETSWIDFSFVAFAKDKLKYFKYFNSHELKFYGQDLLMTIISINEGIKVYCAKGSSYELLKEKASKYTPYSLNHNYKKIYDYFNSDLFLKFKNIHNIELEKMKKINFEVNDVHYIVNPRNFNLDVAGTKRFHKNYNSIYHTGDIIN